MSHFSVIIVNTDGINDIDEQLDLSEYQELTKYKNEITEIGGIEIPPIHFLLLTFFNICV